MLTLIKGFNVLYKRHLSFSLSFSTPRPTHDVDSEEGVGPGKEVI